MNNHEYKILLSSEPYDDIQMPKISNSVRNARCIGKVACKVCGETRKTLYKVAGGYVCQNCKRLEEYHETD